MQIVAIRVSVSALILVAALLITDAKQLKIRPRDIPLFFGTGVCSIVFFNFCYFEAIDLVGGSSLPALLLYTAPIFVMLMSLILFKEKLTKQKIISLFVAVAGLVLVTGAFSGSEHISSKVILLGLGSGFGYALYSIFGKFLIKKYSPVTIIAYTFITASVCVVPFSGIISQIPHIISADGILSSLGISVISTVAPFLLYTKALGKMEAGKAAVLATTEPLVAAAAGLVFFGETMSVPKLAGMILIFAAVIILNCNSQKNAGKTSGK